MSEIKRTINISFAGKRGDDEIQSEKIKSIAPHFATLFAAFDDCFSDTRFHFISGLADDADQIVAKLFIDGEWLSEMTDNEISMGAVLAFGKEDYLDTITDKDTFDCLYRRCPQKLHLDGVYDKSEAGKTNRKLAHRQQSKVIVRMADIVLAAAPRDTQHNAGGTLETVQLALYSGKPVIFYNLDNEKFYFPTAEDWILNNAEPKSIPDIVRIFRDNYYPQTAEVNELKLKKQQELKKNPMYRLRNMAWNFFHNFFERKLNKEIAREKESLETEPAQAENESKTGGKSGPGKLYKAIKNKRDDLGYIISHFQVQYRGGYLLNYSLSIIAVSIAALAICCFIYFPEDCKAHPYILISLGTVKIWIIWLIIKNTVAINRTGYNKTAIDYRYVSERLRADLQLSFAGLIKSVKPSLGNHNKNYFALYPAERLYEKIVAELSCTHYDITLDSKTVIEQVKRIEIDWLDGQLSYHHKDNKRHEIIHDKLEKWAERFGKIVLGIVIAELLLTAVESFAMEEIKCIFHPLKIIIPALLGIATLLPAVVTTLVSISFQAEAKRLSFRSEVISKEINSIKQLLNETIKEYGHSERLAQGSVFSALLDELDKMGKITSDEVAEWSVLYEKSVPETA